jgi:hypothetical protein
MVAQKFARIHRSPDIRAASGERMIDLECVIVSAVNCRRTIEKREEDRHCGKTQLTEQIVSWSLLLWFQSFVVRSGICIILDFFCFDLFLC